MNGRLCDITLCAGHALLVQEMLRELAPKPKEAAARFARSLLAVPLAVGHRRPVGWSQVRLPWPPGGDIGAEDDGRGSSGDHGRHQFI